MAQQLPDTYYRTPYKFNGKELDEETGLYYYGARYYDPKISIWLSVDPLAESFPNWNPYNYTMQNPINLVDPDGRSASPPDDHFDFKGNFLYRDLRNTNNIVIHTGNFLSFSRGDEVELKDFTFNKYNYSTLSNIANHYAPEAGVNLKNLHNQKISVNDEIVVGYSGGAGLGFYRKFNDGNSSTSLIGSTIMNTLKKTVTVNLYNGKIVSLINDYNNFKSVLDHEGGPIGHLVNPNKKHSEIYKDQIEKYSKLITEDYLIHLEKNYETYKNLEKKNN